MKAFLKLLGGPILSRPDGRVLALPTRKSDAMLAYLATRRDEAVSREALAALLWPYSADEQARASLRQEVSVLRKALGPDLADLITAQSDRIVLKAKQLDVDIWQLRANTPVPDDIAGALALCAQYTAPFMDTFRIRSQPYTDWMDETRQAVKARVLTVGQATLRHCSDIKDTENTTKLAQQLCRIEPTYEPAHRALIENHLRDGDRAAAHRQLQLCENALRAGLDVDVSAQTRALFDCSEPVATTRDSPVAQRRFVTALSVAANLDIADPEDFDRAAAAVTSQVCQCVEDHGGTILDVSGDHVLACFGYPIGHDRDPDTGIFAARAVHDVLQSENDQGPTFKIGLSYGQALFAPLANASGPSYSGPVFRAAEAVSFRGPATTVLVDDALANVLLPRTALAAVDGAPNVWQVLPRHQHEPNRQQALVPEQRHDMVGRQAQLDQLLQMLECAQDGQGGAAAIVGAPGSGKSRLAQEVAQNAAALGFDVRVFHGSLSQQHATFGPILDHAFRTGELTDDRIRAVDLAAWLVGLHADLADAAPYFEALLEDRDIDGPQMPNVPPKAKDAALQFFVGQASAAGTAKPLCLVFEDVHWFDTTTRAAIAELIATVAKTPAVALLISRAGEVPTIAIQDGVQQIAVDPLAPESAKLLLGGLLGQVAASHDVLENVLDRAEGNPLVLEEFAKAIAFAADRSDLTTPSLNAAHGDAHIATPDRLLPLLLSRIDNVPGAIEVLQHASVFGRKFTDEQLAHVTPSAGRWGAVSAALEETGIIFANPQGTQISYLFKHAMIAEAIYATIPKRDRPAMHIAAAQTLLVDRQRVPYSEVAGHFRSAGVYDQAAHYFEQSGDQAARVSANAEAISQYRDALAMIVQIPQTPDRLRQELRLNRKTAAQMIALHGIPTPQVANYYTTAQKLSATLGDQEEFVNAAWGLWSIQLIAADLDNCLATASGLGPTVDALGSPVATLIHHYMLGVTHAYRGTLPDAADQLEAVLLAYDETLKEDLQSRFGMDIGLTANSFLGWVYALLGRKNDADLAAQRALTQAHANDNGLSHVFANVFAATKCLFQDQLQDARRHAQTAFEGADAMGFRHWSAQARIQLARVADLSGDIGALEDMQQARDAYMSTGMVLARSYADVWVAAAQNRNGQPQNALETLDSLQAYTERSNQRYFEFAAKSARMQAHDDIAKTGS